MITLFRRMREKLISSGSLTKYLLYAIGEILLVVIGILIALQVNNWNEERISRALEQDYYCRFLENIQQDLIQVNSLIQETKNRLESTNELLRALQKDKTLKIEAGIHTQGSTRGVTVFFQPTRTAYENLKSGANLSIIRDTHVIESLIQYYNKAEGYTEIARYNANVLADRYSKYEDLFETGYVHSRMNTDLFINGMDKDVYDKFTIDDSEFLSAEYQKALINDGILYLSIHIRSIELHSLLKQDIYQLQHLLISKCNDPEVFEDI